MSENMPRPIRKVGIADHLWEALEQMAREMGSDREGLINQALFMFARLNGFLTPAPVGPSRSAGGNGALRGSTPPPGDGLPDRTPSPPGMASRRQPASGARLPPADAVLDAPMSARRRGDSDSQPRRGEPIPPPPDAFDAEPSPPASMDNDPARIAVAQRVLETAAELESLIKGKQQGDGAQGPDSTGVDGAPAPGERALYMNAEGHELERITKDRYLIGRGKHCDLVINSGKVSREHAAIIREGGEYYLQDLDSSNGTWFNKQRIKRRKIEDGDEYFICSDKVKFVFR